MTRKKMIINITILITLIIITFSLLIKDNNIYLIMNNLKNVDFKYILIGLFLMLIFIILESLNNHIILSTLNNKVTFLMCFKYACVGIFFSSITPSSSGGQPLQLYYMNKDKIPMSDSLIVLLIELFALQTIACLFALIGFILNFNIITKITYLKYLIFIGLLINIFLLISLLVLLFSKKIALKILKIITKILAKFHYKKSLNFYNTCLKEINKYHESAIYLKNHPQTIYKTFIISFLKLFIYYSIPFFVYLSFNISFYTIFDFVFLESILYISVAILPFPGGVGISEKVFLSIFNLLFPKSLLESAMILSRGISFYFPLIFTGIFILCNYLISKKSHNLKFIKFKKHQNNML